MNRDDEFELRVAEWLQEGPDVALASSVDAAMAKVRRVRPRRRRWDRVRRWLRMRWTDDSLEAVRSRRGRQSLAAVASIALAVTVLTAFAIVRIPPPSASIPPSIGPTRRPPPSPTPRSSLADLPVVLDPEAFSTRCSDQDSGTSSYVGTTHVTAGIVIRCSDGSNDPRLTGVGYRTYTNELDRDGTERSYGTGTLTNQGGSWTLVFTELRLPGEKAGLNRSYWLGSGGYAGLQARVQLLMYPDGITMQQPGILEVVASVASGASAGCRAGGQPPNLPATGEAVLDCALSAEDPRLSGTRTLTLRLSARGDGTSAVTGSVKVANVAGSWSGTVTGVLGRDGRLSLDETNLVGSGMYAGFTYAGTVAGPADQLAITGTISPLP